MNGNEFVSSGQPGYMCNYAHARTPSQGHTHTHIYIYIIYVGILEGHELCPGHVGSFSLNVLCTTKYKCALMSKTRTGHAVNLLCKTRFHKGRGRGGGF